MATRPKSRISPSSLTFKFISSSALSGFVPRLGKVTIQRHDGSEPVQIETPALLAATSRGVVPHLSRDHVRSTRAIRWVHVPFESFLEHLPPVPTLQEGAHPLHTFLGYSPAQHIISMSARDPFDGREMPPNGQDHIAAYCIRGVRKITSSSWISYAMACKPDLVVALSDTPFTSAPYSQKRLTKSLERSAAWLSDLLSSATDAATLSSDEDPTQPTLQRPQNILCHLGGGASVPARRAFAESLLEPLDSKELARLKPLRSLDEGVCGYVFDLVPLRTALAAQTSDNLAVLLAPGTPDPNTDGIHTLMRTSLSRLPHEKPRIVHSAKSPHEMLRLIKDVGIDLFDAHWAQRAADIGIALDFCFPVPAIRQPSRPDENQTMCTAPRKRQNHKSDLGHNLYDPAYAQDHSRLAANFLDAASAHRSPTFPVCHCEACSPSAPSLRLRHSAIDVLPSREASDVSPLPPFTRSYLHHLLHTHEMSSHSLLVMHNLAVLDAFFAGVRAVLANPIDVAGFERHVETFLASYDEDMVLFDEAKVIWAEVELARGKGRLAREKVKQMESNLGMAFGS
ncbi:tRNA-guanine(15) transglycosylase-like protein [Amylocystis lapponica]|nr:tRNA-guanine(15) transglycosylase-like protein [Amylocystis lapponica]